MWLRIATTSPYSPDLAPSDFYLFPKLKVHLRGRRNTCDKDVIDAVEEFLDDQYTAFYQNEVQCIEVHGDYVEK